MQFFLLKIFSKTGRFIIGALLLLGGIWWGVSYITGVFRKAKEYDRITIENASLTSERKALRDSLALQKEWLAKALFEAENSKELYTLTKGMTKSFQEVIKVMRDSVISINQDRVKLEGINLELQKKIEKSQRRRGLF